jgi:hypothetical protein
MILAIAPDHPVWWLALNPVPKQMLLPIPYRLFVINAVILLHSA